MLRHFVCPIVPHDGHAGGRGAGGGRVAHTGAAWRRVNSMSRFRVGLSGKSGTWESGKRKLKSRGKRKEPGHYSGLYQHTLFFGRDTTPNEESLPETGISACHQLWGQCVRTGNPAGRPPKGRLSASVPTANETTTEGVSHMIVGGNGMDGRFNPTSPCPSPSHPMGRRGNRIVIFNRG